MAETKEVLSFAVDLGEALLKNGAEVYRVEESVLKIMNAYDITDCDVYVLTNGIFASANEGDSDSGSIIRHVPLAPTHLGRIAALNNLCREVCDGNMTIEDACYELENIKQIPLYPNYLLLLATGIGCGCFTYLFGGSPIDGVLSCLVGFILKLLLDIMEKSKTSKAVTNVLGAAIVSAIAIALYACKLPIHYDKIIIGDIMPLVPGIALTTSIRDFVNGDYLSGTIRLIDALLTAFCIAVGVGIVITLFHIFGGGSLSL